MNEVKPGEIYRHFKGNRYEIVGIAKHSETLCDYVVYKKVNGDEMWIRPLDMFTETIERDGKIIRRFEKQ